MKYGWANPKDGTREQDENLENAKLRLWTELQQTEEPYWPLYVQFDAGTVTSSQEAKVFDADLQGMEFAWCDPNSGRRLVSDTWPAALIQKAIAEQQPRFTDEVAVYWQKLECTVHKDDLKPELPPFVPTMHNRPISSRISLAELYEEMFAVSASVHMEPGVVIGKVQALALLDIAESLRRRPDYSRRYTRRNPGRKRRHHRGWIARVFDWIRDYFSLNRKPKPGSWDWMDRETAEPPTDPGAQAEALKRFDSTWDRLQEVAGAKPAEPYYSSESLCSCMSNGIAADGQYCTCEKGRDLKRLAIIQGRPLPEPVPGCAACYMHPPAKEGQPVYKCTSCSRECYIEVGHTDIPQSQKSNAERHTFAGSGAFGKCQVCGETLGSSKHWETMRHTFRGNDELTACLDCGKHATDKIHGYTGI